MARRPRRCVRVRLRLDEAGEHLSSVVFPAPLGPNTARFGRLYGEGDVVESRDGTEAMPQPLSQQHRWRREARSVVGFDEVATVPQVEPRSSTAPCSRRRSSTTTGSVAEFANAAAAARSRRCRERMSRTKTSARNWSAGAWLRAAGRVAWILAPARTAQGVFAGLLHLDEETFRGGGRHRAQSTSGTPVSNSEQVVQLGENKKETQLSFGAPQAHGSGGARRLAAGSASAHPGLRCRRASPRQIDHQAAAPWQAGPAPPRQPANSGADSRSALGRDSLLHRARRHECVSPRALVT